MMIGEQLTTRGGAAISALFWATAGAVACTGPDAPAGTSIEANVTGNHEPGGVPSATEEPGEFGDEQTYELRLNEAPPLPITLEMNREEVSKLFGDRASDVLLVGIDPTTLLSESLERIRNSCGLLWREDDPNPRHDCSQTELGRTFAGPDGAWQTSAEYALVRLLTMTPANVDVSGTSSESLRELADALGIGGGYSQILSDALGVARTDPVLSTAGLVESLKKNFVGSHPNVGADTSLGITLRDALADLSTLAERYGPTGGHPGVIDPAFPPSGAVLGPEFTMRVSASSNLRLCDGIDADAGKGFLSLVADEVGPTFEDELELDFDDPAKFGVTGLVENPTVDLRLRILEADALVPSCLGARCQSNAPGAPVDDTSVWAIEPWLLEYMVAAGARNDYVDRVFDGSYLFGLARISLGQEPAPPGWMTYAVPLNLGDPPEDQYAWETIVEVAQVALHRTPFATIPEGEAGVAFTLYGVPVGLTGTEAAQKVRPYLKEQASALSEVLLGDYKKNNDRVDFYYRRADSGASYLFFVSEADMKEGELYGYQRPGFFRTSKLEDKLSSAHVQGLSDDTHEKLAISGSDLTVYFEDDGGAIYRARIVPDASSSDLVIHLARKVN
jgi:hypothetical protein